MEDAYFICSPLHITFNNEIQLRLNPRMELPTKFIKIEIVIHQTYIITQEHAYYYDWAITCDAILKWI